MHKNKELHSFLLAKARDLTEEWYNSLDKKDSSGVYASDDPKVINTLKKQNFDFHLHLCEVFIKEETEFLEEFQKWILSIAQDPQHLKTPIHFMLREFFRVREQYLDYIKDFVVLHMDEYSNEVIDSWNRVILKAFDKVMLGFVEEHQYYLQRKLSAQGELIQELSSPVISLDNEVALLPLVGEIDTRRARVMLEKTLSQCAHLGVDFLVIDLSGVPMIDTMVAQQIFQLIKGLELMGVTSTLSGVRPEIAQTAVRLGLEFNGVSTYSTLRQALNSMGIVKR
ncbi:STAS domain-containing protein [Neobacillus drentensis]|uniref:STAS domain-containing protein n=1 Tax=Neobacillus drentensis TaxID=220684 RepID=UPI001F3A2589|nr:STAS domain-containing protein [Neobacillus drentensis]ULT59391.1 STAS domain-containing protein [Neobacillus drentensis]